MTEPRSLQLYGCGRAPGLEQHGSRLLPGESWIIPVVTSPRRSPKYLLICQAAWNKMRPLTAIGAYGPPETCRLRVTPIATHTPTHLSMALRAFPIFAPSQ